MSEKPVPEVPVGRKKFNLYILIVALTVLVYYTLVGIWPFIYNIFLTFRKTDLITENKFIGLSNYEYMIGDPIFWQSLWHNIYYLLIMVSLGIVTSLIIAALISKTKGIMRKIYTAMFFAPVVTSMVAISLVWTLLYFPKIGVFATVLSRVFGFDRANLNFLADTSTALLCIIIMDVWRDTGIRTVIFLAGIDEIPDSLYETARIDGASTVRQFFRITIPLLTPQLIFIAAIYSINAIRVYVPIYMMTGSPPGGPANSTMVLTLHMYLSAFYGQRFGYGSALSMVMFILLFGLVLLEIKAFQQKWEY
ncbi:MAG: sugar ABC transporter permease [Spirochaetota bacterium]